MVLKYTYKSDSGLLEAYKSYTIAQNSSLSNTVVITSTDPNAADYKYCLEFICYNYKGVPKAHYASPFLEYTEEGITFTIPASLTQYKGHVNMQMTGYSTEYNTVVFKSVNKGANAFDVEGSLNVVENDIANVPNIFTEFLEELEFYRNKHAELISELDFYRSQRSEILEEIEFYKSQRAGIMQTLETKCEEAAAAARDCIMEDYGDIVSELVQERVKYNPFYKVTFKIYGEVIKSMVISGGLKITPPTYTLPANCQVVGGWYELDKDRLWNFEEDEVNSDVELTLNFMTNGVEFNPNGKVKSLANATGDVYLPDYYNGKRVTHTENVVINISDNINVHFGHFTNYYVGLIALGDNMKNMYYPKDGNYYFCKNCLYSKKEKLDVEAIVFAPRNTTQSITIQSGSQTIAMYAISHNANIKKISIPPTVTLIAANAVMATGITSIKIPASVESIASQSFCNNASLTDVYLEGDLSEKINANTFIDKTVTPNRRPVLHVLPQYYNKYIGKGLNNYYTIQITGKEFFDGNYAAKEQPTE